MTQYLAKTRIFSYFLTISVAVWVAPNSVFAETFTSTEHKFSFELPQGFEAKKDPAPGVSVLVFNKSQNFPTFNVIIRPGPYPGTALTEDMRTQQIVDSYKEVGISDAKPISGDTSLLGSHGIFSAEIAYNSQGREMISSVDIIPGNQQHYILTFIDLKASYPTSKKLHDQFLGTFVAYDRPKEKVPTLETQSLRLSNSALLISAVLATLFVFWLFRIKHLSKR